jgi:hypothetical protein
VRPSFGEVHDLALMDPQHREHATQEKQGQMGISAESAVGRQHVAFAQLGMHLDHPRDVVRAQRRGQHFHDHARCGVHQRQEMRHRKSTSWLLSSRLAECSL